MLYDKQRDATGDRPYCGQEIPVGSLVHYPDDPHDQGFVIDWWGSEEGIGVAWVDGEIEPIGYRGLLMDAERLHVVVLMRGDVQWPRWARELGRDLFERLCPNCSGSDDIDGIRCHVRPGRCVRAK